MRFQLGFKAKRFILLGGLGGTFFVSCAHQIRLENSKVYSSRASAGFESQKAPSTFIETVSRDAAIPQNQQSGGVAELEQGLKNEPMLDEEIDDGQVPLTGILRRELLRDNSVKKWIRYFSKRDKARFQRHIDRAEPYRKVVQEILVGEGVPPDIFYLAIIESGFRSEAKSSANAVGVWQFIAPTGTRYGLKVNRWVDERRDVIRATQAAAKYLKDLHNVFNSWELALAAYNTGEGRVLRAILRAKSRDFWTLLHRGVLPKETQDYVPKFVAAAYIYENAEKFGFELPEDEEHPRLAVVELPPRVRLLDVARIGGVNYNKLVFYNPHLLRRQTPPTNRTYKIWVPRQHQQKVIAALGRLPRGAQSLMMAKSLGFSPQVKKVARNNSARDPFSHATRKKRAVASKSKQGKRSYQRRADARLRNTDKFKRIYVRRGQTLLGIAGAYGMKLDELKKINKLASGRVMAGQGLLVRVKASSLGFRPRTNTASRTNSGSSKVVRYRVKKGDSLFSIAGQFGVSVKQLRKDNRLRRETLYAGETIRISQREI